MSSASVTTTDSAHWNAPLEIAIEPPTASRFEMVETDGRPSSPRAAGLAGSGQSPVDAFGDADDPPGEESVAEPSDAWSHAANASAAITRAAERRRVPDITMRLQGGTRYLVHR